MTLIRRVLTSFREDEQTEAQMFQKDDGTFWLRASDGTETQVGSAQPQYTISYTLPTGYLQPSSAPVVRGEMSLAPIGFDGVVAGAPWGPGFSGYAVTAPITAGAGGMVVSFSTDESFVLVGLPADWVLFDLALRATVSSLDGDQILGVAIDAGLNTGTTEAALQMEDAVITQVAGSDLTWTQINTSDWQVASTAGGTFVVSVSFTGKND